MDNYAGQSGPSNSVRRYLFFLRTYWWVPLLTLILAIGGAIAYGVLTPPVYTSAASMWETEKLHLSEGALFTEDPTTYIGTQIELLKSVRMQLAAVDRLRSSGTNTPVPLGKDGLPLQVSLNFREAPKSSVFLITASSADAAFSQNFLDALMNAYLEYKKSIRKLVSGDTAASISAQVEDAESALKDAEEALSVFQRTNNLAILQEEGTVAGGYLEKLETDLSDLKLESQLLQAGAAAHLPDAAIGTNDRAATGLITSIGSSNQAPLDLEQLTPYQQLELLKIQREKLSKYLRPKHPKIVALDEQIARGEKLIELIRNQDHDQLLASQAAVKMKIESVLASIKEWQSKVMESSGRIAEAERLKQDVARAQSLYDRLALLLQNVDITRNTDMETLAILEPASGAKRSYSKIVQAAALAIFAGLGLGAGIVFLIEKRDDRFTCASEVHTSLGDAIVGLVPEIGRNGKEETVLLQHGDTRHNYAESYRRLRSALLFLATDGERPKVLLVTSAMPNEGKTMVAANLARTLALSGSRVLLVDGDLRRGMLHRSLKMQAEPGLAELLLHTTTPDSVIQRNSLPNFAFVSSGSHDGNPADLFLSSELDKVLAGWRRDFDYVVIDSCPVFAADDASCLAPKVDGTLIVVRRSHSSAKAVREAVELLAQRQAKLLGIIFNGADPSERDYYYDKYADYYTTARKTA